MTISYFTVGAVLEEQAGDSDAGERGGTVEQAPLSPLLRAAMTPSTKPIRTQRSSRDSR